MHDMRYLMTLVETHSMVKTPICEGTERRFFLHVSDAKNRASIVKNGLVANHHTQYDVEWASLEGIYLTDEISLISHMIENRDDLTKFMIVVIEADGDVLLPDEDIINIILGKFHQERISGRYKEEDEASIIPILSQLFAEHVGGITEDVKELVEEWYRGFILGGDTDPFYWGEMKDQAVRKYRDMKAHGSSTHSFRYPGNIGFEGNPRIVSVLAVASGRFKTVVGKTPSEAGHLVTGLAQAIGLEDCSGKSPKVSPEIQALRSKLIALVDKIKPYANEADTRKQVYALDKAGLDNYIERANEMLARKR